MESEFTTMTTSAATRAPTTLGGWVNDFFQPYQIQSHLQLHYIPDLTDLRTYNDRALAARRSASDSYVYEIAPDMFHRGIMRELPQSGNKWATDDGSHAGYAVEHLYMDDQSYQRYRHHVRHWEVDEYESLLGTAAVEHRLMEQ